MISALLISAGWASADKPVKAISPATQPTVAGEKSAELTPEKKRTEAYNKLLKAARESMVIVRTYYTKDLTDPKAKEDASDIYNNYIEKKRPSETTGVVLEGGLVLIADDGVEDRFVEKIEVEDAAGNKSTAVRTRLLYKAPNIMLELTGPATEKFQAVEFSPIEFDSPYPQLAQTALSKNEDRWQISVKPIMLYEPFQQTENPNQFFGRRMSYYRRYGMGVDSRDTGIINDGDGRPIGCGSTGYFDLLQKECIWQGADIVKAEGLAWKDLQQAQADVRKTLTPGIFKVILKSRKGDNGSERYYYGNSDASGTEEEHFGFAFSDTEIFVPVNIDRKKASKVTGIFVKFSPKKRAQAKFVGCYKDFGAFVIKLEDQKLPAHIKPALEPLGRMVPFLDALAVEKFGKKYLKVRTNRLVGKARGYKGLYYWEPMQSMKYGTMLLDFQGQLEGVYLKQRKEYAEQEMKRDDFYYSFNDDDMNRIVTIDELRELLKYPEKFMDPNIKILQKRIQAERHAWLGVEFVPISSKLAKFWKVEKPTKDGSIGLIVNAIYPSSPAEKMGLKLGDILLKVKAPGRDYPTELGEGLGTDDMSMFYRYQSMMGDSGLWKSRKNILTELLDAIGVGKTVTITYCRRDPKDQTTPAKEMTLDYEIALAPPDLAAAKKWQNRKLGLTVKDMTYEVRYALGLTENDPGVVVVKTEPGSAVQIARIEPMEIITHLDGQALTSARQMRDLISQAKQLGQEKVRLTIQRLGKTRFADLNITTYDSSDDEGLENEISPDEVDLDVNIDS